MYNNTNVSIYVKIDNYSLAFSMVFLTWMTTLPHVLRCSRVTKASATRSNG